MIWGHQYHESDEIEFFRQCNLKDVDDSLVPLLDCARFSQEQPGSSFKGKTRYASADVLP